MAKTKAIRWKKVGDCIKCISHCSDGHGYPLLTRFGIRTTVARHILLKRLGRLTSKIFACHICDRRWCINPHHIIAGSFVDNMKDAIRRKRFVCGPRHWNFKLTDKAKRQIKKLIAQENKTQTEIGCLFGVTQSMISRIKTEQRGLLT